jgi:hypothetical protein
LRGYYSCRRRSADGNDGRTDGEEGGDEDGKAGTQIGIGMTGQDQERTGSAEKLDAEEDYNGGLRERTK